MSGIITTIFKILLSVIVTVVLGLSSGLVTRTSINTWYPTLHKPWFNPPNWLFPIAWTILYILMGIAAGLVWSDIHTDPEAKPALKFYIAQLVLNMLWSFIFFGCQSPGLALSEIITLWIAIYITRHQFQQVSGLAELLFLPYLLWVSYALLLNAAIWWLN